MWVFHHLDTKGGGGQLPDQSCQTVRSISLVSKQPADMVTKNDVPFQPGHEFWKALVVQNNCH